VGIASVAGFDTSVPAVISDFIRSRTERFKNAKEVEDAGGGENLRPHFSNQVVSDTFSLSRPHHR